MKLLQAAGVFILLILVLLIGGVAYLTLTEAGTQWLLTQVTRAVPGELQVKQIEGRLGEAFTLTGLYYHTPDFTLEIGHLELAWRPAAFLDTTLWIKRLHLREVTWRQESQKNPSVSKETIVLPEVRLPLKVIAESIQIQDLSLQRPKSPPMVIETIAFKGNFDGQSLTVAELGVSTPEGKLRVSGEVAPHDAYPLEFAIQWMAPIPKLGKVAGVGRVEGDLRQLTLHQEVQTPFQLRLRGRFFDLLGQPRWVAVLEVPEAELRQVSSQWPAVRLGLDLKGAGGLDQFKIRGSYQLQGPQLGKLSGQISGEQVAMGHWVLHQLSLEQAQGQGYLAIHGDVALTEDHPRFTLQGQWQDLAWPLMGAAVFSSKEGWVFLDGSTENYHLKVKTALAGQEIPASKWRLSGVGNTTQFKLEQLQGHLLDGILSGAGNLRWAPAPAWKLKLAGKSLNPGKQWPEWPGKLAFSIDTNGVFQDSGRAMMVNIHALSGSLRSYPVAAQGQIQLQNAIWRITDLKFHSGDSRFLMDGTVSNHLALDWQLISPDLSQLAPAARGNLRAKGRLRGQLKLPELILHLQGKKLAYQDFRVASVTAHVNLDSQGKRPSQLLLKTTDLSVATQVFHSLNIQGEGTPLQHELNLVVKAPERFLNLEVDGSWKEPVWQGEIRKAQLSDFMIGRWEMMSPTPLTLSRGGIDLALWCWQQQAAQLCLEGSWQQGKAWQASLNITDFPLAVFTSFLPEKTTLEGTIMGKAQVQGEAHQLMQAGVRLNASAGRLIQVTPEGQTLIFPHRGLQAKLHLGEEKREEGSLQLQLLLAEPSAAPISASLHLPPPPLDLTALDQLPLDGRVSMAFGNLAFLETLLPELQAVQGQLRANLDLGGRIAAPRLLGQVVLQEGRAQIPALGLELTEIWLQADAGETGRVIFEGGVQSGQGQLAFNGQARLDPAAGWPASLTVVGERFEAMGTSEVKVLISPQLQITVAKEGIHVEGEVTIPEATLVVKDIERRGGIPVSKDVVIISKEKESAAKTMAMPIYARVRIILGDKVTVQAFGFRGGVAGNLLVTETPRRPTRGSGEIRVVEGQYKAYGQQLDIREGRAIFAGPIDNPQLDVEAVRKIENDDVVAGVRIRGSANAPVLTLFSEPPMNESDILAYLILGRPLTAASGDEGELLAKAATSLGLASGNFLAQRIGKIFGLEEVGIENTNGRTQSAALMLGKHLSPRLYIGYGIGIFERFNAFRMRYTLSKHWNLQAETGLESGADLFYTLER
jgi:translocation and assembly module TamB